MVRGRRNTQPPPPATTETDAAEENDERIRDETETTEARGVGDNSGELTDDQRSALTMSHARKYDEALKKKKAAANDFLKVCKQAKADLGSDAIDDIKDILLIKEDEDAFKAKMERQAKVARWMALPIGAEPSLFTEDRMPAVDRAYEEGKRAGIDGEPRKPPYDSSVPQYGRWLEGYAKGQESLMAGFKKLNPDTPLEAAVAEKTAADGQPAAADATDGLPRGSVPANGEAREPWPDDKDIGTAKPSLKVVE